MRSAFWLSIKAATVATTIAIVLGSAAAFGLQRYKFFGRNAISLLLVLPIALPGIITGMALNSFFSFWNINLSYWTIVIGHATFCMVIVFNNVPFAAAFATVPVIIMGIYLTLARRAGATEAL